MNIYAPPEKELYPHVLIAFSGSSKVTRSRVAQLKPVTSLFLDSGAYGAWSIGRQLDVRDYAVWVRRMAVHVPEAHIASLDVIPGVKGRPATAGQIRLAMHQGDLHANMLRASGLKVCAYHFGEPIERLHELVERRQPGELLCLGGLVGRRSPDILAFCDGVFHELGKLPLMPPVHGFGLTRFKIMRRYPWYSCDSTTNRAPRRFGQMLTREGTEVWIEKDRPERRQSKQLIEYHMNDILRRWTLIEEETTRTWARRGVVFAP